MDNNILLAYVLIVLGHLLMGSELVLPSHGVSFALGVGAIVVGIVMIFGNSSSHGLVTMIAVAMLMVTIGADPGPFLAANADGQTPGAGRRG